MDPQCLWVSRGFRWLWQSPGWTSCEVRESSHMKVTGCLPPPPQLTLHSPVSLIRHTNLVVRRQLINVVGCGVWSGHQGHGGVWDILFLVDYERRCHLPLQMHFLCDGGCNVFCAGWNQVCCNQKLGWKSQSAWGSCQPWIGDWRLKGQFDLDGSILWQLYSNLVFWTDRDGLCCLFWSVRKIKLITAETGVETDELLQSQTQVITQTDREAKVDCRLWLGRCLIWWWSTQISCGGWQAFW